ncbi:MAG TPA: MBL fold metallo-hydrolase, partial [Rhizobiaceae bacterium]|nr:MBL fold metallo-hydrolase [Rhizobiaceae bacterium]
MAQSEKAELVFCPLGGVGEIGMNLALYGFGPPSSREWIIVDCGVSFPGPDLPGVELVLPDIRFIEEELENLRGIVITHAHEDHYGALLDLWPRLG